MNIRIRGQKGAIAATLRAHVQRQLDFALARFANEIDRVSVRLSDGGPQDGGSRRCRIDVASPVLQLRVEDADPDAFAAVTWAVRRAARAVARALERERGS